jgi:glucan phosphoethanolaminetransferase (alkaline phosphatase superfamily)
VTTQPQTDNRKTQIRQRSGSLLPLLLLTQGLFCVLEAYLISKISLIGKIGIATVHKEYKLLRSGWKTFLLLFGIQASIILILYIIQKKNTKKITTLVISILLLLGILGLFVTFQDFLHTYTHRLLKERFHLGFYFFWLAWIGTCLYFLVTTHKETKNTGLFPLDPNSPLNNQ